MIYENEKEIFSQGIISEENGRIVIKDQPSLINKMVDDIADTITISGSSRLKKICYWIAYEIGLQLGVIPSSIQGLYEARGKYYVSGFTVPAMNLRTLTYDLARAVFRSANKINAASLIFEIAKSEIGYTGQRPQEYVAVLMLAAVKEGFRGPLFVQGDHFQVKAKNFFIDSGKEISGLKNLMVEAISAGFYNIDIDSSTLVDLSKNTLDEQQKLNYEICSLLTKHIRKLQPAGIDISVGGEIGEVGGKNSTPEELHAYMKGYLKDLGGLKGISKISIQTGTTHGGVVLPDGSIAKVSIDFDTLKNLSEMSRKEYDIAGAVQHGASTLPNEAFHRFSEVECAEIHLATQFQNLVYEYLPLDLKEEIYDWLKNNLSNERKPDWSNDQFIYKTRKKALGPFKAKINSLSRDLKNKISYKLEEEFSFLFDQLKIKDTKGIVDKYIQLVPIKKNKDDFLEEDKDLGVLEGAD